MSSIFGKLLQVSTFGESHGAAIGAVVDGVPSGLHITEDIIQKELDRRRPGTSKFVSPRKEADKVEILSGTNNGISLGTPIAMLIRNTNQRSKDYGDLLEKFRPGHADYAYFRKYGTFPQPGGGRSSGRETAARVAAGAIARVILGNKVSILSATSRIGNVEAKMPLDFSFANENPLRFGDREKAPEAEAAVEKAMSDLDSLGGMVTLSIKNIPAGLGEPVFDKLDATLGAALFSIGSIKGVEFGSGFNAAAMYGSEFNDEIEQEGTSWPTNHSGGILGGISTGQPIVINMAVKPTPSISRKQATIDIEGNKTTVEVKGRHDPCLCPRVGVVAEAMAALALADALLVNKRLSLPECRF